MIEQITMQHIVASIHKLFYSSVMDQKYQEPVI